MDEEKTTLLVADPDLGDAAKQDTSKHHRIPLWVFVGIIVLFSLLITIFSTAYHSLSQEVMHISGQLAEKDAQLDSLNSQIYDQDKTIDELNAQIAQQKRTIEGLDDQSAVIERLYNQLREQEEIVARQDLILDSLGLSPSGALDDIITQYID